MFRLNRKLSKKGFTLVELMVAVGILAVASIGIFQAFSVGFQSMADAKYRTVATNIAQEKLEKVKNSVAVAYPYYSIGYQELSGKTFTIIVTTDSKEDNLEQVYVTVSWHDRQGNEKNVQLETLVYDLQIDYAVTPPDVDQIHLSAYPTEITCCVVTETSTITAELFNLAGDRVPSGTPVSFDVNNGSVSPEFTTTDTIGRATTQLTINGLGPATVTATSGTISSNDPEPHGDGAALQITCVPKAGAIVLSASPSAITPGNSSTITATVTDTCGDLLSEELGQVDVKFVTNKGSFDNIIPTVETTVPTVGGIATVNLYMGTSGEVATVYGTITVDEVDISDSTTVLCTNYSISVTANPTSINPGGDNDTSIITAVLTQSGGSPAVGETISFTTDIGSLSAATATTDSNGQAVVTLSSLSGGNIATITASYEITPGNTISDTATIQCTEYVINIVANPNKVIPGSPSTITATLTNYEGNPASNRRVDFYSTKGILSDTSVYTNSNGIAVTTLTLNTVGDIANVSATYGFAIDSVNVECIEFILVLNAVPTSITPGESSKITATLTNYEGIAQNDKTITFTTNEGSFGNGGQTIEATTGDGQPAGQAVVFLTLNLTGTATVTATYTNEIPASEISDTTTITCMLIKNVGDSYGGGIVAYILVPGDPGYDASMQHGLIAATADQSTGIRWYKGSYITTGASGTALGTGFANTNTIISIQGATTTSYAAGLARSYNGGGYTDWYLPSRDELNKLWINRAKIGGFSYYYYWSSSEYSAYYSYSPYYASAQYFSSGSQGYYDKYYNFRVRAVRAF